MSWPGTDFCTSSPGTDPGCRQVQNLRQPADAEPLLLVCLIVASSHWRSSACTGPFQPNTAATCRPGADSSTAGWQDQLVSVGECVLFLNQGVGIADPSSEVGQRTGSTGSAPSSSATRAAGGLGPGAPVLPRKMLPGTGFHAVPNHQGDECKPQRTHRSHCDTATHRHAWPVVDADGAQQGGAGTSDQQQHRQLPAEPHLHRTAGGRSWTMRPGSMAALGGRQGDCWKPAMPGGSPSEGFVTLH